MGEDPVKDRFILLRWTPICMNLTSVDHFVFKELLGKG